GPRGGRPDPATGREFPVPGTRAIGFAATRWLAGQDPADLDVLRGRMPPQQGHPGRDRASRIRARTPRSVRLQSQHGARQATRERHRAQAGLNPGKLPSEESNGYACILDSPAYRERSLVPLMKTKKAGSFELQVQDLLL